MVTTTCKELVGDECTVPLRGTSLEELQECVFEHARARHAAELAGMSEADKQAMFRRIREVYDEKAALAAG
ncbi:MAG: hypothetical protein HY079_13190 [Elusimicrobia bacterium]|nr:hypothetical protein [Elusimicrobiota bacterium]